MDTDKLKQDLQDWVNQINVYNKGCMCKWCTGQIFANMKLIMEKHAHELRLRYDSELVELRQPDVIKSVCECNILFKDRDRMELFQGCKECKKPISQTVL